MLTRRHFLAGSTALGATLLSGATRAQAAPQLTLYGPPASPSVALAHVAASGNLEPRFSNVDFKVWRNPDQLRAGVVSGEMKITGTPSYVAANMANQGVGVRMLNVMTWGLLYVMSTEDSVEKFEDLAGKTLLLFYKNDMPDLVLSHIATQSGMIPGKDFKVHYVSDPMQAVTMLITGRADLAVLPEPAATASQMKGMMNGVSVRRALNLQDEWARVTGRAPRLPQAGVLVTEKLIQEQPDLVGELQKTIAHSSAWAINNPASAGALAADYMGVSPKVIEKSIPWSNLDAVAAADAREDLEYFFTVLLNKSPAIMGGRLPDSSFYLGA